MKTTTFSFTEAMRAMNNALFLDDDDIAADIEVDPSLPDYTGKF